MGGPTWTLVALVSWMCSIVVTLSVEPWRLAVCGGFVLFVVGLCSRAMEYIPDNWPGGASWRRDDG